MVEQLKDYAPWFGRGRGDMELKEKEDGLCDYMFSVAIENSNQYFSEKLLDCFLTGTIPIYYATPSDDKWLGKAYKWVIDGLALNILKAKKINKIRSCSDTSSSYQN